ncbi:MAG: PEGA domain-containing protein [Gemmatimonadetes bacterium]|nr:PEGA domain-containing protein [Gemmatimonadota bacterium]
MTVTVRDARTGKPPMQPVTLVVREGIYADSETVDLGGRVTKGPLAAAWERPGTYHVTVHSEGYRTWTRQNVVARETKCNLAGARLDATLEPGVQ